MKLLIVIVIYLLFNVCLAQTRKNEEFFLTEYGASVNHSIYNPNIQTWGYGIGGYKSFKLKTEIYFISGIEYNYSKQVQGFEFNGGHNTSNSDTNNFLLSINTLTIPANIRIFYGSQKKIFTDFGIFLENNISSKKALSFNPNETNSNYTFNNGINIQMVNLGLNVGSGIKFEFNSIDLLLKSEFRMGLFNSRYVRISLGINLKQS
ncbi:MAG: hypothetical protein WCH03_01960 [Flavobacteriia bacterium]|jgi:tRNA G10  N-methylase Trm11